MHEKHLNAICGQRRPRSACAFAQADQGLRFPLIESMNSVVYVDKRRMLRLDCMNTHANLGPVVQSIVSLKSLLVVKILTVLVSTIFVSQIFLLKKCE